MIIYSRNLNNLTKFTQCVFYGGVAQLGAQGTQKRTLRKFNKNQLLSVLKHGGVAHLGAQGTQKRTLRKFNKN